MSNDHLRDLPLIEGNDEHRVDDPEVFRDPPAGVPVGIEHQLDGMNLRSGRTVHPVPSYISGLGIGSGRVGSGRAPRGEATSAATGTESFITVDTLAAALSRNSNRGGSDITKGVLPVWHHKSESFVAFEQKVVLWASQHSIEHLLTDPPSADEETQHKKARAVVLSQLPQSDRTTVFNKSYLHEAWSYLKQKYRPSVEAEVDDLWFRFNNLHQGNRSVRDYVGDVMSIHSQLQSLGEEVGERWVRLKLLNLNSDYDHLRSELMKKSPDEIVSVICQHAHYLESRTRGQGQPGGRNPAGGANRGFNRHVRGHGSGGRGSGPGAGAGEVVVAAVSADESRTCHECGKKGHLKMNCPQLKPDVRAYLQAQHDKRRKGKQVPDVLAMEYDASYPASAKEPWVIVIDSGTDIHVVGNRDMLLDYAPCHLTASPAGPAALGVVGKGTLLVSIGEYVDVHGNSHPIDVEIPDVHYSPECPYNLLATSELHYEHIYLCTRRRVVTFPGRPDQHMGYVKDNMSQEADPDGNPCFVFHTGVGKPVMRVKPVNSGVAWSTGGGVDQCLIARDRQVVAALDVGLPAGQAVHYVPDRTFVAHLSFHVANWVLRRMEANPDLYGDLNLAVPPGNVGVSGRNHGTRLAVPPYGGDSRNDRKLTGKPEGPGHILHADLTGPITPTGVGGFKYVLVVVCAHTRYTFAVPLKSKSEAPEMLSYVIERIRVHVIQPGEKGVKILHSDQGGEFTNAALTKYCGRRGIRQTWTGTADHKSNGLVERRIGTLMSAVRAAILPSCLPLYLWPECVMSVAHGQNLTPNSALYHERRETFVRDMVAKDKGAVSAEMADQIKRGVAKKQAIEADKARMMESAKGRAMAAFERSLADRVDGDVIPYLAFFRSTSEQHFKDLLHQQRPWGTPVYAFPREEHARKLQARGIVGYWVGAGAGPSMQRVFTQDTPGGRVRAMRCAVGTADLLAAHVRRYDMHEVAQDIADGEIAPRAGQHTFQWNGGEEIGPDDIEDFTDRQVFDGTLLRQRRDHLHMPPGHGSFPALEEVHAEPDLDHQIHQRLYSPRAAASAEVQQRDPARDTPGLVKSVFRAAQEVSRAQLSGAPVAELNLPPTSRVRTAVLTRDTNVVHPKLWHESADDDEDMSPLTEDLLEDLATGDRANDDDDEDDDDSLYECNDHSDMPSMWPLGTHAAAAEAADLADETTSTPAPDAQGSAGPSRGTGGVTPAAAAAGGTQLDLLADEEMDVVSGGEFAPDPPNALSFDPPAEVRVDTAVRKVRFNPLVRKRLIPRSVDVAAVEVSADSDADCETAAAIVSSSTVREDTSVATDSGVSHAGLECQSGIPGKQHSAKRKESRRAVAARKQKPADPDLPTLKEGLASPQREQWLQAMREEVEALREHGTFSLCTLPAGKSAISGKWVLKIKRGPAGEVQRYKARYVARGFSQVEGVDFFETWSPVGRYATLRVLLAIAAREDLEIKHVDIQCAFLNGELEEEVFVEQPPLFTDGTARVWKLHKTLYGLKQAAREWHKALVKVLAEMGFVVSHSDPGLYVRKVGRCFIFLWVDDLFIFSSPAGLQDLIETILTKFEGRDLGDLAWALGTEIMRDRNAKTITMTQRNKIHNLLEKYSMLDCRKSPTPLVPRQQLRSLKEHPELEKASSAEHARFMSAVGSIQYIAGVTRPDLAFAAHALARHMAASAKEHWLAIQHVLRYLQSTKNLGLVFNGSNNNTCLLEAYTDADFANGPDLKSVSGTLVRVYGNCVFWRSKRQDTIAGDTTEAELIAMSSAANELMWSKQLLLDLHLKPVRPVLWGDNKSANILAVNAVSSDRSKHIRVKHLRVREYVERDEVRVEWIGTTDQLADVFTKILPGPALATVRDRLQLNDTS